MKDFEAEFIDVIKDLAANGELAIRLDEEMLTPSTRVSALGLDSLTLEYLSLELTDKYGLELPDETYASGPTLSELAMMLAVHRLNPQAFSSRPGGRE